VADIDVYCYECGAFIGVCAIQYTARKIVRVSPCGNCRDILKDGYEEKIKELDRELDELEKVAVEDEKRAFDKGYAVGLKEGRNEPAF
jgi:cytidine deaminase